MKRKAILKTLVTIIFIVVAIIPFLDWNKKNEIQDEFNDIEHRIHQSEDSALFDHCETVIEFVSEHPTIKEIKLKCNTYDKVDSSTIQTFHTDFVAKVHDIENDYRSQERVANRWMFVILIASQIFTAIARTLIDKHLS